MFNLFSKWLDKPAEPNRRVYRFEPTKQVNLDHCTEKFTFFEKGTTGAIDVTWEYRIWVTVYRTQSGNFITMTRSLRKSDIGADPVFKVISRDEAIKLYQHVIWESERYPELRRVIYDAGDWGPTYNIGEV